jgi:hypothetical protein
VDNKIKQAAFASFSMLMRPVARILLRCGVTWKELADLVKVVYVEAAIADYGKFGRPANSSRVAILTGLSRREVKRVRDLLAAGGAPELEVLGKINQASRVLSGWFQDPDFVAPNGRPRLLLATGERGFAGLTRRYAPDIPATAMLKELKHTGAVQTTRSGRLKATMRYYAPAAPDQEAVLRGGHVLGDLGETVASNLFGGEEPTRFEGRASNVHVARSARRAFRSYIEQRGMAFLEDVDQWLSAHEARKPGAKTERLGIGVYMIQDDSGEEK